MRRGSSTVCFGLDLALVLPGIRDLAAPDGAIVAAGLDVGALAPDGRLRRITGFFGELPAKAA